MFAAVPLDGACDAGLVHVASRGHESTAASTARAAASTARTAVSELTPQTLAVAAFSGLPACIVLPLGLLRKGGLQEKLLMNHVWVRKLA